MHAYIAIYMYTHAYIRIAMHTYIYAHNASSGMLTCTYIHITKYTVTHVLAIYKYIFACTCK